MEDSFSLFIWDFSRLQSVLIQHMILQMLRKHGFQDCRIESTCEVQLFCSHHFASLSTAAGFQLFITPPSPRLHLSGAMTAFSSTFFALSAHANHVRRSHYSGDLVLALGCNQRQAHLIAVVVDVHDLFGHVDLSICHDGTASQGLRPRPSQMTPHAPAVQVTVEPAGSESCLHFHASEVLCSRLVYFIAPTNFCVACTSWPWFGVRPATAFVASSFCSIHVPIFECVLSWPALANAPLAITAPSRA